LASIPVTVRYGVPALVLAFLVFRLWPRSIAVRVVGFLETAAQLEGLTLAVFPFDDTGAGEYPPPAASPASASDGQLRLWMRDLPATGVYLVADSPVHGIATLHVAPHQSQVQLELGVPRRLVGRIETSDGRGLANARVMVMPHRYGPLLAETVSDAAGEFAVERLSSSSSFFAVRVLLAEYTALDADVQLVAGSPLRLTMTRTRPITGTVEVPAGVDAAALTLRVLRLPGPTTKLLADGGFYLDGLPLPPSRVRLLVGGLPDGFTHHACYVSAGEQRVALRVQRAAKVRGVVVTADRDLPVPRAYVEHPHGPRGGAGDYTDSAGRFELHAVPPGLVRIEASGGVPTPASVTAGEPRVPVGFAEVEITAGSDRDGVVVRVH
jgi:hypothetical protein